MTTYSFNISQFPNSKANLDNFDSEIRKSTITVALDSLLSENQNVFVHFKADLSADELNVLNNIVDNHDNVAKNRSVIDVNVIPETKDFIEQGNTTNGMYKTESWVIDIPADSSVVVAQFTKNYNISLLAADLTVTSSMVGDSMISIVSPNTPIGIVTSDSSSNIVSVNSTVVQNLVPGRHVSFNGITLHEVIGVNTDSIVLDTDVSVQAGTYVLMNIMIVPYFYFYTPQNIHIGKSISTGQRIPKGVPIQITYYNNSGIAKKIAFLVEYLY